MMLKNKVAVIYGAGGGVGSAVARAFGRGLTCGATTPHDPGASIGPSGLPSALLQLGP